MMTNEEARENWTRCRPWIIAALKHSEGGYAIEDVEDGIRDGRLHFWPGTKSAAITVVQEFPRKKFLHVFLAGGDLEELKAMVPCFASWAAYLKCDGLTLSGRRGWERALKLQGWRPATVGLILPLSEIRK